MANSNDKLTALPSLLLDWYGRAARVLPWRIGPKARADGAVPDPYRIWLSEIMLQQTTIAHATRYFQDFTSRWPNVDALAAARDADIMAAWAGLGYYARARNLLACAREVVALGGFPQTVPQLLSLPGIGPYTAGAVAAIAFGAREAAVDGNVERVFARLMALRGEWKDEKKRIQAVVGALVPVERSGEFAEALMDLGATLCTPKAPKCEACPLSRLCVSREEGAPERYPIKPEKPARPRRYGAVFILTHNDEILLEQRPNKGLLGGMLGLPTSEWIGERAKCPEFPHASDWSEIGLVRHVFTHFSLELTVWRGELHKARPEGLWIRQADVKGLPSVFAKALKEAGF